MQKEICLNLTEVMNGIYEREGTFATAVNRYLEESNYTRFERIYAGSSFCASYFLRMTNDMIQSLCLLCEKNHIKYTLVLPMFTERFLIQAKEKIAQIIQQSGIYLDEITVNDFGMMEYIKGVASQKLNMGRLFMKDYRDKRYEEYYELTLQPKIFNEEMKKLAKEYKINGMEFDLTHKTIDMSNAWDDVLLCFYYPYCYQTVGNICEAGSSGQPLDQKYRPNAPCQMECEEQHLLLQSKEGYDYIKRGRAVFFEHRECEIQNANKIRLLYTPNCFGGKK